MSTHLKGYAAVFYKPGDAGTEYQLWDGCIERIAKGAFDAALERGDDARGLWNHDPTYLLGRRSAGTLKLSTDSRGLLYQIDGGIGLGWQAVADAVKRGDANGSSFAFIVGRELWELDGNTTIRTIEEVELIDVSPVAFPAYSSTTAYLIGEPVPVRYDEYIRGKQEQEARARRAALVREVEIAGLDL